MKSQGGNASRTQKKKTSQDDEDDEDDEDEVKEEVVHRGVPEWEYPHVRRGMHVLNRSV